MLGAMAVAGCSRSENTTPVADAPADRPAASPAPSDDSPPPVTDTRPLWPTDQTPPGDSTPPPIRQPASESVEPNPLRSVTAAGAESTDAGDTNQTVAPNEQSPSAPPKNKHEPLFEGWPKPQVAIVLTGQQHGYIEPCGCTGLANQKGGLARRHTFIRQLREEQGWPVVAVDVGNQIRRRGQQSAIKFTRSIEGLRKMDYAAVTLGSDDLQFASPGDLYAAMLDGQPNIFTSANVALFTRDEQPTTRVVEAGGKKIGIAAVLGSKYEELLPKGGDEVLYSPPLEALRKAAQELQAQKCDFYILLAHAPLDESKKLATDVPIFDLVVTSGGYGEPTLDLEPIRGTKSLLAQVGTKGMYTGVVGLFNDKETPIRYERVPLDDRFKDSPEMLALLAEYQQQLQQTGLQDLGAVPQPHPSGRTFVGSDTCADCHTKASAVWEKTPHAHATDSLVHPMERAEIARHFDPECLSCHVTGWEPQKFHPFDSGYLSLEETPKLQHNGCENCHGPGSDHVAAENGEGNPTEADIAQRRDEMKLPLAGGVAERKCMECHDLDNSPDFHLEGAFEKYWKQVEHRGKD
jgi:hypothetical protein